MSSQGQQLRKNALWVFGGQGASLFLQAGYFVLLARLLGVEEYGVFAGVFALVSTLMPYSSLGSGMLFMRYVNTDPSSARSYWGYSLCAPIVCSCTLAGLLYVFGPRITGSNDRILIVAVVFANCLFAQIVQSASRIFQTYEALRMTALLTFLSNLFRLIVLVAMFVTMPRASARQWAFAALASSIVSAAVASVCVQRIIGGPTINLPLMRQRWLEGLGFSVAGSTQFAYNDIDKTMLSHYGLIAEAGFYTLAYRVIDFATTPIGSIDAAVLPRLFKLANAGVQAVATLTKRALMISAAIGALIAGVVLAFSPLLPRVVGHDFAQAVGVLKWICWIPLLRAVHLLCGSTLTALGKQPYRTATQTAVAVLNLLLNLWLIPAHGWLGAAWSSLACDGLLSVLNAGALMGILAVRRQSQVLAVASAELP